MKRIDLVASGLVIAFVATPAAVQGTTPPPAPPEIAGRLAVVPAMAAPNSTVKIGGHIPPWSRHRVELQRRESGRFVAIATRWTNSDGRFSFKSVLPAAGPRAVFRVVSPRQQGASSPFKTSVTPNRSVILTFATTTSITRSGQNSQPAMTPDGRFIAHSTWRVPRDMSGVFVWDRSTGTRIQIADTTGPGYPTISSDGRYVAYQTLRKSGDTWVEDVWVWDRATGTATRITGSNTYGATHGDDFGASPAISGDGRYVTYNSDATNHLSSDTNKGEDVFVWDRADGSTTRLTNGNAYSFAPSISADGRYIAYVSEASNLAAGDTNHSSDVFVWDRADGSTTRLTTGNAYSTAASISADGNHVSYMSSSNVVVPDEVNHWPAVFVWDRATNTHAGVTHGEAWTDEPAISADGNHVTYVAEASDLVPGDTNGHLDVFVWDRATGSTSRVTNGNDVTSSPVLSADGGLVTYVSRADNLVKGDTNAYEDVFVWERGAD